MTKPKSTVKMPDAVWDEIRDEYEAGHSCVSIIKKYGVAEATLHWRRAKGKWQRKTTKEAEKAVRMATIEPTPTNIRAAVSVLEKRVQADVPSTSRPRGGAADLKSARAALPVEALRTMNLVDILIAKLTQILKSVQLTDDDTPLRERTKSFLDLTNALQKLQEIERTALGFDDGRVNAGGTVVIMVPQKQNEDDWSRNVKQIQPLRVENSE